MSNSLERLEQALKDLIEAYSDVEEEIDDKFGDDEEKFSIAMIESMEGAIENAVEEQGYSTSAFAALVGTLSEGLESLDPSAFEEEDDYDYSISGINDIGDDIDEDIDEDDDTDLS